MLNLKRMKSNKKLATNIDLLRGMLSDKKALVLTKKLIDVDASPYKITDFFDVVIAEGLEAINSVPFCDFVVYSSDSLYKNGQLDIQNYITDEAIVCSNYYAVEQLSRLSTKYSFNLLNINYLPVDVEPSKDAEVVRKVKCGLSKDRPGEHLARLLGCSVVMVDPEDLSEYVTKKTRIVPDNLVAPSRQPLAKTKF